MFKCKDCGCEFEEPKEIIEYHGLDYGYEKLYGCPHCGGGDYEESTTCDICGEPSWSGCFCDKCKDDVKFMLKIDFRYFDNAKMEDLFDLFSESLDEMRDDFKRSERSKR